MILPYNIVIQNYSLRNVDAELTVDEDLNGHYGPQKIWTVYPGLLWKLFAKTEILWRYQLGPHTRAVPFCTCRIWLKINIGW